MIYPVEVGIDDLDDILNSDMDSGPKKGKMDKGQIETEKSWDCSFITNIDCLHL